MATAVFISSVAVYTGMIASHPFFFHYSQLFQFPPAIHRLVTSFLITGPQIAIIFEPYFLYSYLSQLEKENSKFSRKEDLVWYLMFVGSVIIVSSKVSFTLTLAIPRTLLWSSPCLPPPSPLPLPYLLPQNICPGSVLPLQLSRFLELRKITPALDTGPSFAYLF